MSNRLDQKREALLQPVRIKTCKASLEEMGYKVYQDDDNKSLEFKVDLPCAKRPVNIKLFPYSGYWSGKHIGSGRGFRNMLAAIKAKQEDL